MAIVRMLIVLSAQLPVVNHLEHVCSFFCAVRQADACQLLRNLNPQQHFYHFLSAWYRKLKTFRIFLPLDC